MTQPATTRTAISLQTRVNCWLERLSASLPAPVPARVLDQLSPVKKHKNRAAKSPTGLNAGAAALLLRMLSERVVALSCESVNPEIINLLAGPPGLPPVEADREVLDGINALEAADLTGWELAGVQLWQAEENHLQKRSGAFYTSPQLARYITAQTLESPAQAGRVVDPACGGGAFLLAACERLLAFEPGIDPLALVRGRIYGLDLNPFAASLARLALLRRLSELYNRRVPVELAVLLAAQVRPGNALLGPVRTPGVLSARREALLAACGEGGSLEAAFACYRDWEAGLRKAETAHAEAIAALPIFNSPQDGAKLAALHPFGWETAFPEVFSAGGFSAVLGNPPYVGFNDYSGVEKAFFAAAYAPVYNLKSDLYYYFIKRGLELLAPGGRLGFVTSRFWKEAAFAARLRRWLAAETRLLAIEDLGGEQFFEEANVDVCLLFAANEKARPDYHFAFGFEGRREELAQSALAGGAPWTWLRRIPAERLLLAKIEEQSCRLGEIARCRTGVQTGLDRVFFVDSAQAGQLRLEPAVLRQAIKNAAIRPGSLEWRDLWLVFIPPGQNPAAYPAALAYLERHREALEMRRRYDQPFPFFELQWPREPDLFEAPLKLVTPYKAARNTFALDAQQFYFSTDVISVVFTAGHGLERLALNFLNSRLATFQFRSSGKPVGGGQWDYYANPVKKLVFPRLALLSPQDSRLAALAQAGLSQAGIDELACDLYALTPAERDLLSALPL